jgi:hypothetical protein
MLFHIVCLKACDVEVEEYLSTMKRCELVCCHHHGQVRAEFCSVVDAKIPDNRQSKVAPRPDRSRSGTHRMIIIIIIIIITTWSSTMNE